MNRLNENSHGQEAESIHLSVVTSAIVALNESGHFLALPPISVRIRNEPSPLICATGEARPTPNPTSLNKSRPLASGVLSLIMVPTLGLLL